MKWQTNSDKASLWEKIALKFCDTHPSYTKRIAYLRKLDAEARAKIDLN